MAMTSIWEEPVNPAHAKVLAEYRRTRVAALVAQLGALRGTTAGHEGRAGTSNTAMDGEGPADPVKQLALQRSGKRTVLDRDQVRAATWFRALASEATLYGSHRTIDYQADKVDVSSHGGDLVNSLGIDQRAAALSDMGKIAEQIGEQQFLLVFSVVVRFVTLANAAMMIEDDSQAIDANKPREATKKLTGRLLRTALRQIAQNMPSDIELQENIKNSRK